MPNNRNSKLHKRDVEHQFKIDNHNFVAHGLSARLWEDLYHYAMTSSWPVFFLAAGILFCSLNFFFALFYMAGETPIANLYPNGFWGAFFFSVETLATVGYGDMHPQSIYGHIISTLEIFIGMIDIAMVTGVIFARFSLPKSKILFTKHPITHVHNGKYVLSIRIANARFNVISEASAKLRLIRLESTAEDPRFLRIIDLPLVRETHPMFTLGWSLFHIIDEKSPLYQQTADDLAKRQVRLILSLEGIDDTTSQSIRARHVYPHDTIRFNHRYQDISHLDKDMVNHVEYSLFDAIKEVKEVKEENPGAGKNDPQGKAKTPAKPDTYSSTQPPKKPS